MHFIVSPGQMRVIVVVTAKGALVRIQTFGARCEGILTPELFLICNEHLLEILVGFLMYKAVMQDGGFVSGWNGVGMFQSVHLLPDKCRTGMVTFPMPWFHPV